MIISRLLLVQVARYRCAWAIFSVSGLFLYSALLLQQQAATSLANSDNLPDNCYNKYSSYSFNYPLLNAIAVNFSLDNYYIVLYPLGDNIP